MARHHAIAASVVLGTFVPLTVLTEPSAAAKPDTVQTTAMQEVAVEADFDGDGQRDGAFLSSERTTPSGANCVVRFELADGSQKVQRYQTNLSKPWDEDPKLLCFDRSSIHAADFTGDGRHELLITWRNYEPGAPLSKAPIVGVDSVRFSSSDIAHRENRHMHLADFNGDNRVDMLQYGADSWTDTPGFGNETIRWSLTTPDGEPFAGKLHEAQGYGVSVGEMDTSSPGVEILIPSGVKRAGGYSCTLSVVRQGVFLRSHSLRLNTECRPESSSLQDTDGDGQVDTAVVQWAKLSPDSNVVQRFTTKHTFNKLGEFIDAPTVNPKNPIANRDYVKMSFQWGLVGKVLVLKNDKHIEGGNLSIVSGPRHGTATVEGDRIVYTRTTMKPGWDVLVYKVTTPNGKSATAKLRIQMVGTPPAIEPKKRSIAKNDRVHMFPGKFEIADINVLRNDTLHGPVKVAVRSQPRIGKAKALDNGRIRYDRRGKGYGTDRFTYTITDSAGRTSTAVVLVETPGRN